MAAAAAAAAPAPAPAPATGGDAVLLKVGDAVRAEYALLKTRRKYQYMVFNIVGESEVVIEATGAPGAKVKDLIKALPMAAARYAVYDHAVTTRDGRKKDELYFVLWSPPAAATKSKLLFTSQRRNLDKVFTGVKDVQCGTPEEVAKVFGDTSYDAADEDDWDPDA